MNKAPITKDEDLTGRIALVTGASRGIGAAIAKKLAAHHAHVILVARTVGGLEETYDAITEKGGQASILPMDLTKNREVEKLAPTIIERFGRLDILIGNAGTLGALSPVAQSEEKLWKQVMKLNVFGNVNLIRSLDPLLRGSDAGRAVFLTSAICHDDKPFWGAYAASKSALETIARTYAAEVSHSPLKVNLFDPGIVATSLRSSAFPGEDTKTLNQPDAVIDYIFPLCLPSCQEHAQTICHHDDQLPEQATQS